MQGIFDADPRPSAYLAVRAKIDDPDLIGFAEAGANGLPMPAIQAMSTVWSAWGDAETLIFQQSEAPDVAFKLGGADSHRHRRPVMGAAVNSRAGAACHRWQTGSTLLASIFRLGALAVIDTVAIWLLYQMFNDGVWQLGLAIGIVTVLLNLIFLAKIFTLCAGFRQVSGSTDCPGCLPDPLQHLHRFYQLRRRPSAHPTPGGATAGKAALSL